MEGQRERGNESYDWSKFDIDSYLGHYYNEAHPDDDALCSPTYKLEPGPPARDGPVLS